MEVKPEPVRDCVSEPRSAGSDGLSNLQLATMAIAAAVTAANLYYCQPLLSQIARSLHMTARETADIPMLTQIGYALGLLFFAPLGDMVERRRLVTVLLLIADATGKLTNPVFYIKMLCIFFAIAIGFCAYAALATAATLRVKEPAATQPSKQQNYWFLSRLKIG